VLAYPPENRELQDRIAREHLLISQVAGIALSPPRSLRATGTSFPERQRDDERA